MDAIAGIEDLYRAHARMVHAYLVRRTRDPSLAADLMQETFANATRAFLGWSGGSAEGWLLAIARNALVDHARRRHLELAPVAVDELYDDVRDETDVEMSAAVNDVFARLPDGQARLLRLAYVDGFRSAEIAAMTGTAEGTVRMALHRARIAFRAAWNDTNEEEKP